MNRIEVNKKDIQLPEASRGGRREDRKRSIPFGRRGSPAVVRVYQMNSRESHVFLLEPLHQVLHTEAVRKQLHLAPEEVLGAGNQERSGSISISMSP